jgi:hypothetical protein
LPANGTTQSATIRPPPPAFCQLSLPRAGALNTSTCPPPRRT